MPTHFGRYTLDKRIAVGGMGELFLAHAPGSATPVVVKRVLPHLADNAQFKDLFLDEARIAARLHHPNVVRILELGDVDGAWFIVMDYVAGSDLRRLLDATRAQKSALPLGVACRVIADAATALAYAHTAADPQGRALHVVHRDVSPHNLLVGFDGVTRLIDFGVARAARRIGGLDEDALRGKLPYLSPEQAAQAELDHRSDQFSLGIIFWELLTGRRLFQSDSDAKTLQAVEACVVRRPSELAPVPARLDTLVLRMLRKAPADRWPDCEAVRVALEDLLLEAQLPSAPAQVAAFLRGLFPAESSDIGLALRAPAAPPATETAVEAQTWSPESLAPPERLTLAQLSVFDGPASLEAIEAVVDLSSLPHAPWVLDVVQALKDLALVRTEAAQGAPDELRFRLPAEVRVWARAHLETLGADAAPGARERAARFLAEHPASTSTG